MYVYPVDIEPEQIVRWVMAERQATPTAFKIAARKTVETRDIPLQRELHLGDEEREDLNEVAVDAILEITPTHSDDGWLLRIVVEDELGPRVEDRQSSVPSEQEIDIGSFYRQFIRRRRGTATIVAEVDNSAAEQRLRSLLDDITVDRHPVKRNT